MLNSVSFCPVPTAKEVFSAKQRITSAASPGSLQHATAGTSTASSSGSASAAALVAGGLASPSSSLTGPAEKPYFDDVNSRNVTTVVDDTAVLKCRVKHKGDRTLDQTLENAARTGVSERPSGETSVTLAPCVGAYYLGSSLSSSSSSSSPSPPSSSSSSLASSVGSGWTVQSSLQPLEHHSADGLRVGSVSKIEWLKCPTTHK
uniref:Ig-like domain-containing protein n=1 Tax=Anopheles coluzzii TaxID=1518534 RepID=A0A8W7PLY6_ANOCL